MARLINVIHKPHLATFIAYDDSNYRCCVMCKYQAVIEDDNEKLYVVSLLNEDDINELNLEAAIRKVSDVTQKEDWYYRFDRGVSEKDIDNFVNGGGLRLLATAPSVHFVMCLQLFVIRIAPSLRMVWMPCEK